jgi:hypothetical protein
VMILLSERFRSCERQNDIDKTGINDDIEYLKQQRITGKRQWFFKNDCL